jgi:hypothetical protein
VNSVFSHKENNTATLLHADPRRGAVVNSDEIFLMCPFQTVTYAYVKRFQATRLIVSRRATCRRHTLRKEHRKLLLNLKHLQGKLWFDMHSKIECLHHQLN